MVYTYVCKPGPNSGVYVGLNYRKSQPSVILLKKRPLGQVKVCATVPATQEMSGLQAYRPCHWVGQALPRALQ